MRVLMSATRNPNYLPYWKDVSRAWRKLFKSAEPVLAFVDESGEGLEELEKYGEVIHLRPTPNIPIASQACMARLYIACDFEDEACMVNDVDLLPLQNHYFLNLLRGWDDDTIMCVGREVYDGTADQGKFPLAYMTGEGRLIERVCNPKGLEFQEWMESFVGTRVYDDKECPISRYPHGHPECFSDESLIRILLEQSDVPEQHVPRGWSPYTARAIDRACWTWNNEDLLRGRFVEAHLPHPCGEGHKPLMEFLGL